MGCQALLQGIFLLGLAQRKRASPGQDSPGLHGGGLGSLCLSGPPHSLALLPAGLLSSPNLLPCRGPRAQSSQPAFSGLVSGVKTHSQSLPPLLGPRSLPGRTTSPPFGENASPGDFPNPGIEPGSPALQVDSLPAELPRKQKLRQYHKATILQ